MSDAPHWNGMPPGDAAMRDGWHWVRCVVAPSYSAECWFWHAASDAFVLLADDPPAQNDWFPHNYECLGPCLTPAEVAAAVARARREALEEAARVAEYETAAPGMRNMKDLWRQSIGLTVASAIRALAAGGARDE